MKKYRKIPLIKSPQNPSKRINKLIHITLHYLKLY